MASRILGQGDMQTLLDKSVEVVTEKDALDSISKMQHGSFDFDDYYNMINTVGKMGGFQRTLNMIPGMASMDESTMFEAQKKVQFATSILRAMDPEERKNVDLFYDQVIAMLQEINIYLIYLNLVGP